jgi:hypothetical protein
LNALLSLMHSRFPLAIKKAPIRGFEKSSVILLKADS